MYTFRKLIDTYTVENKVIYPDDSVSLYSSRIQVRGEYNYPKDYYIFQIDKDSLLLNGKPPEKLVDQQICTLGQAIYPMALTVSEAGELLGVKDFEEIQKRWYATAEQLLKDNGVCMQHYIDVAKANMQNKNTFLQALKKDVFVQLFFPDIKQDMLSITRYNFPVKGKNTFYTELSLNKDNSFVSFDEYIYKEDTTYGQVTYQYGKRQDIISISAIFKQMYQNEQYENCVSIVANMTDRIVRKSNKTLSLLID